VRKETTHKQALRAALQVARGNRKQRGAVVTGLVMLGGCGGDDVAQSSQEDAELSSATDVSQTSNDVEALVDSLDQAAADTLSQDVEAEVDTAALEEDIGAIETQSDALAEDSSGSESSDATESVDDAMAMDDVSSAEDVTASADTAVEEESDVVECLDSCWKPNGKECNEHMDCAVPEDIIGACAGSEEECVYDFECQESGDCVGGMPSVYPNLDPETGELYEFSSGVACFDGVCHEGDQISAEAQACCSFQFSETLPWCDELSAPLGGCTPWGPPAPPSYDGTTLAQRMKQWLS